MAASIPLFFVGNLLIEIVLWDVVVAVSARNPRAAVATVAWGRGVTGFGSVAGAALGAWSASAGSEAVPLMVSGVLLVAVVAYAFSACAASAFRWWLPAWSL